MVREAARASREGRSTRAWAEGPRPTGQRRGGVRRARSRRRRRRSAAARWRGGGGRGGGGGGVGGKGGGGTRLAKASRGSRRYRAHLRSSSSPCPGGRAGRPSARGSRGWARPVRGQKREAEVQEAWARDAPARAPRAQVGWFRGHSGVRAHRPGGLACRAGQPVATCCGGARRGVGGARCEWRNQPHKLQRSAAAAAASAAAGGGRRRCGARTYG